MDLIYYIGLFERIEILKQQGYDYDDQNSTRSRRAQLILDALDAVEYYKQLEFDMELIFLGKLHMRRYRKKYDTIMRMGRAKRDAAKRIIQMSGVEREDKTLRAIRLASDTDRSALDDREWSA